MQTIFTIKYYIVVFIYPKKGNIISFDYTIYNTSKGFSYSFTISQIHYIILHETKFCNQFLSFLKYSFGRFQLYLIANNRNKVMITILTIIDIL